ncbi:MAG: DNA methyltransferase [Anaerolineales bacterium]
MKPIPHPLKGTSNTLFYGDNLPILREHISDESVDLVYLDPPFNSQRVYNVSLRDETGQEAQAQIEAFKDFWRWEETAQAFDELRETAPASVVTLMAALREIVGETPLLAYLTMMTARLLELRRVLKSDGSLYLHCDPTASHYLKIVLDTIFGKENFRNEIAWKRTSAHSSAKRYGPIHDVVFFYSKTDVYHWSNIKTEHNREYIEKNFTRKDDLTGKYFQPVDLTGAGIRKGESGLPWRDINPTDAGRHWALPGAILKSLHSTEGTVQERLDALDSAGRIYWPKKAGGVPRLKWFVDDTEGGSLADVWTDIFPVSAQAAERMGYPTQKPLALLERIIQASSEEGDVVLDPFCGCGTAVVAAQKLNRKWIGIDITYLSIALMKYRLQDSFALTGGKDYAILGEPEDLASARQLAKDDRYQFQFWALSLIGAKPLGGETGSKQGRKGADKGVDGYLFFVDAPGETTYKTIVQVKSGHVQDSHIRDLIGAMENEKAPIGVFLTLEEPTRNMLTTAASAGFYSSPTWQKKYPKIQILTIADLFSGKRVETPPARNPFKQAERIKRKDGTQSELGL